MLAILAFSLAGLTACAKSGTADPKGVSHEIREGAAKGDVSTDLCREFPVDFVYSATGKPIVKVEPSALKGVFACRYYFDYKPDFFKQGDFQAPGGPNVNIVLDNLSVENNKKGIEFLGAKYAADPQIPMENYVVRRTKDNSIWQVTLVINPNRFVWTDSLNKGLTDEELLNFSIKVAEKIQGKLNLEIKKNPVEAEIINPDGTPQMPEPAAAADDQNEEPTADQGGQQALAENFIQNIADKKFDKALAMMDANESTKQGWRENFNQIKSLQIKFVEPYLREEWSAAREMYKFTLEASVTAKGEQWGWNNGENFRWVVVEKNGDNWQVHELANNP